MCYRPSVRLSVRSSHGWISQKRFKLGLCNFHHTVAPSLFCLRYKFHPEIPTGSPRAGASNKGGSGKRDNIVGLLMLSPGGSTSLTVRIAVEESIPNSQLIARWRLSRALTPALARLSCCLTLCTANAIDFATVV